MRFATITNSNAYFSANILQTLSKATICARNTSFILLANNANRNRLNIK